LCFTQWKTRSLYSLTIYEKIYSCLSLISLLVLLGLTIDRLIVLKSSDPDFTFAFLLFWTTCFCFVYIIQVLIKSLLNKVWDKLIINISIFREYFVSEPLNWWHLWPLFSLLSFMSYSIIRQTVLRIIRPLKLY
jgi:hypothetical protein